MPAFLAEDNLCGKTLLQLVSRGNSIVAELCRLAQNIPPYLSPLYTEMQAMALHFHTSDSISMRNARSLSFYGELTLVLGWLSSGSGSPGIVVDPDQQKYAKILFNFAYLKDQDEFERRVNQSTELTDIDIEFQENNQTLLERVYQLFESILKYHQDLRHFVDDVEAGFHIQHTLSTILLDTVGRQLLCEAVYLFGVMLLMMETYLPGPTRERVVVAYYRKSGQASSTIENFDEIVRLCRSTGYVPGFSKTRPKNYPESFFLRFPLPRELIKLVLGRLQSDDIYLASMAFPDPEHRTTALANQVLNDEAGMMREIVDKHFNDNWIITTYMGHVVDLSLEWAGYRAAKAALDNVLQPQIVSKLNLRNARLIEEAVEDVKGYLVEGILTEQFVIDNIQPMIDCMRKCNVALRWRMLHRRTTNRKFYDMIVTAQLEWRLKSVFESLLEAKDKSCEECKKQSVQRLMELSEFFSGEKALTRIQRDESLMRWFATTANEVNNLSYDEEHATMTGRKIKEFIKALDEVEQFEELDTNLQIKAYLQETRDFLLQIVRIVNLKQSELNIMDTVSDTSYAWRVMADYVDTIHARVKADPATVVLLRATFLKLASMLDVPLIRINQCDSPDTISVAQYYSSEMVEFLRQVLEVIPQSVFRNLSEIVDIQTNRMRPIPIKLEAVNLKDYAQLDERYHMAKLTHRVSIFTEGILAMEKTLLGVLQVDPRKILEEGLRKELVRKISEAMHETLVFREAATGGNAGAEVERVMNALAVRMVAFRRSIEYVQDYIDLAGLKIWQEELSRVIYYNIEQECNRFLKKKVYDHMSVFQSRAIPIPRFPPLDNESTTFMGRVLAAVLKMTDPKTTVFAPESPGWYQQSDGSEVSGISTFSLLNRAIGVIGLGGLDRLLGFHIVHELGQFLQFYKIQVRDVMPSLETFSDRLFPPWSCPNTAPKLYATAKAQLEKLMPPMLGYVQRVGQAQLLRKQIAKELLFGCRMDANLYHQALETLNKAVLNEVRGSNYRNSSPSPSSLLAEMARLLEKSGMDDPLARIYITTDPVEGLSAFLLIFTISYLPKLEWDRNYATLVRKKSSYPIDGHVLIVGLMTVLKQFHPLYTVQYLKSLGQFIRVSIDAVFKANSQRLADTELPAELMTLVMFTRNLSNLLKLPKDVLMPIIPPHFVQGVKVTN